MIVRSSATRKTLSRTEMRTETVFTELVDFVTSSDGELIGWIGWSVASLSAMVTFCVRGRNFSVFPRLYFNEGQCVYTQPVWKAKFLNQVNLAILFIDGDLHDSQRSYLSSVGTIYQPPRAQQTPNARTHSVGDPNNLAVAPLIVFICKEYFDNKIDEMASLLTWCLEQLVQGRQFQRRPAVGPLKF